MTTPRMPSATNVFVPEATGQAIAYVRDPKRFKINKYYQVVTAKKPVVLYAFLDPDAPVRVVSDEEFDWPFGQERPKPAGNIGNFQWVEVRVNRRAYGYTMDQEVVDNADGWNPKAFFDANILSIAMTNVTNRFVRMYENTANWGSNTATATSLSGGAGYWSNASNDETSSSFLAIKKTLAEAKRRINLATNGMVSESDLKLVLSPDAALAMSNTAEIHTYLEKSRYSLPVLQGNIQGSNDTWDLPSVLYGLEVVVEDAPYANVRMNSSGTVATIGTEKVYAKSKTSAMICTRSGGLDGNYGSPPASTLQRYVYKWDMSVETFPDAQNGIYRSWVVDCFKEVLPAPQSGFLITGILPA